MRRMNNISIYISGSIVILAIIILSLWQHASIELQHLPMTISKVEDGLFEVDSASVKRDPFAFRMVERQQRSGPVDARILTPVSPQKENSLATQMVYVGSMVKAGKKMAFILHRDDMIVVSVGDFVATKYRLTKIDNEFVTLNEEPEGKAYKLYMSGSAQ